MNTVILFETLAAQGRSMTWLASQLGIGRVMLSHYKSGYRTMPVDVALRAAAILGLPESVILSGEKVAA